MYFICQHSFAAVEPPIEFDAVQNFVKQLAPALRVCLFCLKLLITVNGLPFPIPNIGFEEQLSLQMAFLNAVMDEEAKGIIDEIETSLAEGSSLSLSDGRLEKLIGLATN